MLGYLSEDATELSIVHIFPDSESMELHLQGVDDRAAKAFEFIDTVAYEIYGRPSDQVLEVMQEFARKLGVELTVQPELFGGFLRLKSG